MELQAVRLLRDPAQIRYSPTHARLHEGLLSDPNQPPEPARIQPEENPSEEQSRILAKTLLTPDSEPLNLFRTLVKYPEMMKRVNALGGMFMAHGSLSPREREIVILRVAWNSDCDYEFAQHAPIGRRMGLTDIEIASLGQSGPAGGWDDTDRAVIQFTDEVMAAGEASESTWEALTRNHDEIQLIELTLLVGYYQMLAGFLKTLRVPLEEGSERLPKP